VAALAQCASLPALHALSARAAEFTHEHIVLALQALDRLVGIAGLPGENDLPLANLLLARARQLAGWFDASSVSQVLQCARSLGVVPAQGVLDALLAAALEVAVGFSGEEVTEVVRALDQWKVEPSAELRRVLILRFRP